MSDTGRANEGERAGRWLVENKKGTKDPVNIVELGLVYDCIVEPLGEGERKVNILLTLTAPGCGMGDILVDDVRTKLELIPTVAEADVELVFDPPWNRMMMCEAARLETGML